MITSAARRPKGGAPRGFAKSPLLFVKAVAVAARQRLHHRVVGIAGLQQHQARLLGAAGAARDLVQQLEGALAGAQIAVAPPRSASITPTKVSCGK